MNLMDIRQMCCSIYEATWESALKIVDRIYILVICYLFGIWNSMVYLKRTIKASLIILFNTNLCFFMDFCIIFLDQCSPSAK